MAKNLVPYALLKSVGKGVKYGHVSDDKIRGIVILDKDKSDVENFYQNIISIKQTEDSVERILNILTEAMESSVEKEQEFYQELIKEKNNNLNRANASEELLNNIKIQFSLSGNSPKDKANSVLQDFQSFSKNIDNLGYIYLQSKEIIQAVQRISTQSFIEGLYQPITGAIEREIPEAFSNELNLEDNEYKKQLQDYQAQNGMTLASILDEIKNSHEVIDENNRLVKILVIMLKTSNLRLSYGKGELGKIFNKKKQSKGKAMSKDDALQQNGEILESLYLDVAIDMAQSYAEQSTMDAYEFLTAVHNQTATTKFSLNVHKGVIFTGWQKYEGVKVIDGQNILNISLKNDLKDLDYQYSLNSQKEIYTQKDSENLEKTLQGFAEKGYYKEMSFSILNIIEKAATENIINLKDKQIFTNEDMVKKFSIILQTNFEEFMRRSRKDVRHKYSLSQFVDRLFSNYSKNYKQSTQGTIGEMLGTALLQGYFKNTSLKGQSLNELAQDAHVDILVELNKERGIGIQVKQYNASEAFGTATFYDSEYNIWNNSFLRYFSKGGDQQIGLQTISALRFFSMTSNAKETEKQIKLFLGQYIPSLSRFEDSLGGELKDVQNNFYLYNFRLIPASVIFAKMIIEISEQLNIDSYIDLSKFYLNKDADYEIENNYFEMRNDNLLSFLSQDDLLNGGKSYVNFKGVNIKLSDLNLR